MQGPRGPQRGRKGPRGQEAAAVAGRMEPRQLEGGGSVGGALVGGVVGGGGRRRGTITSPRGRVDEQTRKLRSGLPRCDFATHRQLVRSSSAGTQLLRNNLLSGSRM